MVIPVGYGQFNVRYTGAAVPTGAEWTLGFNFTGAITTPQQAGDIMEQELIDCALMANFCTTIAITSILTKFGPDQTGPSAISPCNIPGLQAGPVVAPNTSVLVRKTTADGGRAGRGRMYLPGPREQDISEGGVVAEAVRAQIETDLNELRTALTAADIVPVVLHGATSPITTPSDITSFSVQTIAATQRRRLRR